MTTDYARLRALAEAAGPFVRYELDDPNPNFIVGSDPGDDSSQIVIGDVYDDRVADYLAAIDPPTMLALLDRLEELEGRDPEWEYGHRYSRMDGSTYVCPVTQATFEARRPTAYRGDLSPYWNYESVRRRKKGEWEPVTGVGDAAP